MLRLSSFFAQARKPATDRLAGLSRLQNVMGAKSQSYSTVTRTYSSDANGEHGISKVPTIEMAKAMPRHFYEMDNSLLLNFCGPQGHKEANEERLRREIMAVDNIEWIEAQQVVGDIEEFNLSGATIKVGLVPFYTGLGLGAFSGALSLPMVFHYKTVHWFNAKYVTADVPEAKDLETWLEVGAWSWNWCEPVLGTASFFLLAAQFTRAQMANLDIRPYGNWLHNYRATRLQSAFPKYDPVILADYCKTHSWTKREDSADDVMARKLLALREQGKI